VLKEHQDKFLKQNMSSILSYIESNSKETLRLIGLDYNQLQKIIQTAEQLHSRKTSFKRIQEIIAGGS